MSGEVPVVTLPDLRLFSSHELVIIWRTVLVIPAVTYNARETFFNQLFGNISAGSVRTINSKLNFKENKDLRALPTVANSCTFSLIELTFARANEIHSDANVFSN